MPIADDQLKALIADDQENEIEGAKAELKRIDARIDVEINFDTAWEKAEKTTYDIAIIDIGWFTDDKTAWKNDVFSDFDKGRAGLRLAEKVRRRNPSAMIIIYSNRVDKFLDAIRANQYFYIKKQYDEKSRYMLRGMVLALLQRLPIEKQLKTQLEEADRHLYEELEKAKNSTSDLLANRKFVLFAVFLGLLVPLLAAAFLYKVTSNLYYSVISLVLSVTLVLIALVATRSLTSQEARQFLDRIYSIKGLNAEPNSSAKSDE